MNMPREFNDQLLHKLDEWFGGAIGGGEPKDKYEILHKWFDTDTAYVVVKTVRKKEHWEKFDHTILYFFRLWKMSGIMEISQDRVVEI